MSLRIQRVHTPILHRRRLYESRRTKTSWIIEGRNVNDAPAASSFTEYDASETTVWASWPAATALQIRSIRRFVWWPVNRRPRINQVGQLTSFPSTRYVNDRPRRLNGRREPVLLGMKAILISNAGTLNHPPFMRPWTVTPRAPGNNPGAVEFISCFANEAFNWTISFELSNKD